MAFVSVPKDLTKVKNKIIFNLTKRQLICFGTVSYTHLDLISSMLLAFAVAIISDISIIQ